MDTTMHIIKNGHVTSLDTSEEASAYLDSPNSELVTKYTNEGCSLLAYDNNENLTCHISSKITYDDFTEILSTIQSLKKEKQHLSKFKCFNYLQDGDYDSIDNISRSSIEPLIVTLCSDKIGTISAHNKKRLDNFRNYNLNKMLMGEISYSHDLPMTAGSSGLIIIGQDFVDKKALNKRTHEELFQATMKKNHNKDITSSEFYRQEHGILGYIVRNTVTVLSASEINDFQREELSKFKEEIKDFQTKTHMPVIVDVGVVKDNQINSVSGLDGFDTLINKQKNRTL